jgi:hypothetical protein
MLLEIWASLKGVVPEGPNYEVSNRGNVRNVVTGRTLKNGTGSHGYHMVTLCSKESKKKYLVHRLVMLALVTQPEGKSVVNHIDGVKTNNFISNLEWVDYTENNRHAWATGLMDREVHRKAVASNGRKVGPISIKFAQEACKKAVTQFDLLGNVIKEFSCGREAQQVTGVPHQTISRQCVTDACKKLRFHSFYFRFSDNVRKEAIN